MTDIKRARYFADSKDDLHNLVEGLRLFAVEPLIVETQTRHVIVCGMHRSASTFVCQVLSRCLGYPMVSLAETYRP